MSALSEPCPSYEPHFWKMGKCKNCFYSRGEHKRYRKELQADEEAASAGEVTPRDGEGDQGKLQLKRREAKEEMKQLRKERKALASKHSELRDTMMTMEAQMLDYKETKQENDILTKDMKLLRKDLHEITAGAARACEQNELLRQEAAMLRLCLAENGVEAPATLLDARFQHQPESPYSSAATSVASSPKHAEQPRSRETKKEAPERAPDNVPALRLATQPEQHQTMSTSPIIHEIDSCMFSLRQNCSTIIQENDEAQAVVSLNFILGMVRALERQSAVAMDFKRTTPRLASPRTSVGSKSFGQRLLGKKEEKEPKETKQQKAKAKPEAAKEEEKEQEEKEAEEETKEVAADEHATASEEATASEGKGGDGESGETKGKKAKKKGSSGSLVKERKTKAKRRESGSSSPAEGRPKARAKKSIGGKLVAGLKKRASLSVPKLSACTGDEAAMADYAAYLEGQALHEEAAFLAFLLAAEKTATAKVGRAHAKALRALCEAHLEGDDRLALAEGLRTQLLEAAAAKTPGPCPALEKAAAAARARLESSFRSFSLRSSSA